MGRKKQEAAQAEAAETAERLAVERALVLQPPPSAGPKPPSDVEMAAIVGAVEVGWPKPTVEEEVTHTADAVWKFANRWWHGAGVAQRSRPRRPRPS